MPARARRVAGPERRRLPPRSSRWDAIVARAFGAHGECVTEPDDLDSAIDRCLSALDDGKAAVLHVHVTPL